MVIETFFFTLKGVINGQTESRASIQQGPKKWRGLYTFFSKKLYRDDKKLESVNSVKMHIWM